MYGASVDTWEDARKELLSPSMINDIFKLFNAKVGY